VPISPHRRQIRAVTARAAVLGAVVVAAVLGAAPAGADSTAVGGPLLAGSGLVLPASGPALPPGLVAASWLVADLNTGQVLGARAPHAPHAPASTLKILTAESLIPKLNPTELVTPTDADVTVDGSRVGLVATMRYPIRQLFTAMLVVSGNDAATTLGDAAGGQAATVAAMNSEASRLGARDTHAVNDDGLDAAGQLSSAYDLALIARAAMAQPAFRGYVATKHASIDGPHGPLMISSHDKLLFNYPGTIGIKNGYTVKAQATFVGAAQRGGHTLVVVLLKTHPRYWPEAAALLNWGFAAEAAHTQPIGELITAHSDATGQHPQTPTGTDTDTARTAAPRHLTTSADLLTSALGASTLLILLAALIQRRRHIVRSRRSTRATRHQLR